MHNWIEKLKLARHVEGGYFVRSYISDDKIITLDKRYTQDLPKQSKNMRYAGSAIYFLLENENFSAWHQLKSDEIWHYYDGDSAIVIHFIDAQGSYSSAILGHPLKNNNAAFQVVVKAGTWFAAELENKKAYALVGCTVNPGFEYQDFILADREKFSDQYPQHANIIKRLTYETIEV